jgi:hypothetical protein
MGRGKDPGCLTGCLTRITSLTIICIVLGATAFFGGRLLWVPDWTVPPPDAAAVQAFSQRAASMALDAKKQGRFGFSEAETNAFLAVKYPSDPVRLTFLEKEIVVGAVARPWPAAQTFLPDSWDAGIRRFRLFLSIQGRPLIENGVLRLEPSSFKLGKQPIPSWLMNASARASGKKLPELQIPATVKALEIEPGQVTVILR